MCTLFSCALRQRAAAFGGGGGAPTPLNHKSLSGGFEVPLSFFLEFPALTDFLHHEMNDTWAKTLKTQENHKPEPHH